MVYRISHEKGSFGTIIIPKSLKDCDSAIYAWIGQVAIELTWQIGFYDDSANNESW